MERRTLIRLLVVFGIGIPLLIEGFTFLGLLEAQLLGGDGGSTPTPTIEGATQGDEILPETTPAETLSTAAFEDGALTLTVSVDNTANASYELRLTDATTREGETVGGNESTGVLAPGESGFATARWTLPGDARPGTVTVVTITRRDAETERTEYAITLGAL
jgi:hypothetical protein